MNISLQAPRWGEDGGTARTVVALARGLAERGHAVQVFVATRQAQVSAPAGVTFGASTLAPRARRGRGSPDVCLCFALAPQMDVYRASGGMHQRWWAARLAVSRWPGARRWLSWHEAALARRERDWLQRAGRLVANAPMNVADLRRNTAPGGPPISLIRNGVDAARFCTDPGARERWRAHLGVPQGGRLVLFAGHGWRRKNADVAWRAFVRVAMPADRLVLAGYEANAARVLRPARRALGERLVHVGPVSDMPGLLAASDVVLHPTWYDPAANIVLEAQACGVPVITTIADGNAERVALPELVVRQPGDVGEVAAALRVALGVEAAGRLACRTLAGAWPSSRMVDDWETLLQEHVDGR